MSYEGAQRAKKYNTRCRKCIRKASKMEMSEAIIGEFNAQELAWIAEWRATHEVTVIEPSNNDDDKYVTGLKMGGRDGH